MDRWDIALIVVATYVAVVSLLRLMAARRDEVVRQLRDQVEQHRRAQPADRQDDRGAA